jgi:hypothetical protein
MYVASGSRDRKMQRALVQFLEPENHFAVREALLHLGRADLIGNGAKEEPVDERGLPNQGY